MRRNFKNFDNIPDEMKTLPNWVVHNKKKMPFTPVLGTCVPAKVNDASTWGDYDVAIQTLKNNKNNLVKFQGVGFVFNGIGFVGIDVDHCLKDGKLTDEATAIVDMLDSYTEISVGGEGLHIIMKGVVPGYAKRKGDYEIYDKDRYFTMTGNVYRNKPIRTDQDRINQFYATFIASNPEPAIPAVKPKKKSPSDEFNEFMHEQERAILLDKIRESKSGKLFTKLFDKGDISDYNGDDSAADMALMNLLPFWTGGNWEEMRELFSLSALAKRDKWQKRKDYQDRTIRAALQSWDKTCYDPEAYKLIDCYHVRPTRYSDEWEQLAKFELSDTGNAERLQYLYGDKLLYVGGGVNRWFVWDNCRWREADSSEAIELYNYVSDTMRITKAVAVDYFACPQNKAEEKAKKGFMAFCTRSENLAGIKQCIQRARKLFFTDIDKLDANRWLLNCQNGTLDMETGTLYACRITDYLTHVTAAPYLPAVTSPLWMQFLQQVLPDSDVREYLQRFMGYCLTGTTREEKILFLYGPGGGGKSTFIETISKALGDYAITIPVETIMQSNVQDGGQSASPFTMALRGKNIAITSESGKGKRLNEAKIKLQTGGDKLVARNLFSSKTSEFTPRHKLIMSSNFMPSLTEAMDEGLHRRLIVVPFTTKITKVDTTLKERLQQPDNLTGVLTWMAEGCWKWKKAGMGPLPTVIKVATGQYFEDNDPLSQFICEHCVKGTGKRVNVTHFCHQYNNWYFVGSSRKVNRNFISQGMATRGFEKKKYADGWYFVGLELRVDSIENPITMA